MVITLCSTFLITLIMVYMIYYNLMSLQAYFGTPEKVTHYKARKTFLILIPAMNEESVISIPVSDLLDQDYPKNKFRVCVVADHCNDNTAKVAIENGACVITENTCPEAKRHGVGKSNTLDYGLHCIPDWKSYDYLIVIDSDNNVSSNFLQRMNDYACQFDEPEAIQACLESKKGHGFINTGLNMSFVRSNYFQQMPESKHDCASILGTGFATSIKKVLAPIDGFRFRTLTEDAYEELSILSNGGRIKFIPDCYIINENYSKLKQAKRGITRWQRGTFQCFLYFFNWSLSHVLIKPSIKSLHVLCRTTTLSKMLQLIIVWGSWLYTYISDAYLTAGFRLLIYPDWLQKVMFIASVIMTINIVLLENFYLLKSKHGLLKTTYMIFQAYLFQLFCNLTGLVAVSTFWKNKWIVSSHGK